MEFKEKDYYDLVVNYYKRSLTTKTFNALCKAELLGRDLKIKGIPKVKERVFRW